MTEKEKEKKAKSRLVAVVLDEASIAPRGPDVEHERNIAIFDLVEENTFAPVGADGVVDYHLRIAVQENRLVFDVSAAEGEAKTTHILSLTPLKKVIRDYFVVCETYYQAIRSASPSQIEAIDMGRRGLHDEGSQLLMERLKGKITVDHETARRLFTLICALHIKV